MDWGNALSDRRAELAPAPEPAPPELTNWRLTTPQFNLDPVVERETNGSMVLGFGEVARFGLSLADRTVTLLSAHPEADQATIDHLLDDHVAPRLIAADGDLVLHGASVAIDGRLAVFLGETGSGKSTLAASLHARGHRLLGDDAVIISEKDGVPAGEPVYPSLRLYPETAAQVFGRPVETAAMAFYSDKVHVAAFGDEQPETQPDAGALPVGGIFILTEGDTGVALHPVWPSDACMALIENSFSLDPHDGAAAARRMANAARLAARVPVQELAYPYDFALLGEAGERVIAALARADDAA